MSTSMTPPQFQHIMNIINNLHAFRVTKMLVKNNKKIKYITPTIDMRDNSVFHIEFESVFTEKTVFSVHDKTEVPMYDRILEWLDTPREEL